jgi:predicted ABC-type ATPase
VRLGGHDIPEGVVRRRYGRSVRNFFTLYRPVVDTWQVYDNSETGLTCLVAHGDGAGRESVLVRETWEEMQRGLSP